MHNKANRNNWNSKWYKQLLKQARYVLKNKNIKSVDPDELVNVAWIRCARYIDSDTEVIEYTKRIRCFMYDYLCKKEKTFGCELLEDDAIHKHTDFTNIEDNDLIEQYLLDLNETERKLIKMRYIIGLTFKEMAVLLGETNHRIVASRTYNVLKKLRSK